MTSRAAIRRRSARAPWRRSLALALLLPCLQAWGAGSLYAIPGPWVDENGRTVALDAWRGRDVLVAMEYSECRFICSAYWIRLMAIQAEADRRHLPVQFVILSLDPEHDSPRQWQAYRRARGLDRDNWHFLTADRHATDQAVAVLGVHWWFDEDHLMHDFRIARLDDQGRVEAVMTTFDQPADLLLAAP